MTILEYYEGLDAAKRALKHGVTEQPQITPNKLRYKYGNYIRKSRHKKGAGKGYSVNYRWQWNDYRGYLNELCELFPKEYALTLCRQEYHDFVSDRWWDMPDYRETAIRDYRNQIKAIRLQYGLSKSEVSDFMRVD